MKTKVQIILSSLYVVADEMDEANQELRVTIKKIWPLQAKKVLDLIIPPDNGMYHIFRSSNFITILKWKPHLFG